ncbi:MAG: hypothetical protein EPO42_09480 [Gallionellaceae bacterium]|nr:MAG: hypothetical protein EPO42_09480 [Gallionellaceae bacterium]
MTRRILLLGATGCTGRLALEYVLSQGMEVAALARSDRRFADECGRCQENHRGLRRGGQCVEQQSHVG